MRLLFITIMLCLLTGCCTTQKKEESVGMSMPRPKIVESVMEMSPPPTPIPVKSSAKLSEVSLPEPIVVQEPILPTPSVKVNIPKKEVVKTVADLLYNTPDKMKVGQSERVEVRIGEVTKLTLVGRGEVKTEIITISPQMKVQLVADKNEFDIVSLGNNDIQIIPQNGYAQWSWKVTPLKSGSRELYLMISQRYPVKGTEGFEDRPPIVRVIDVKVDPIKSVIDFLKDYWQWLVGFLVSSGLFKFAIGKFTNKVD